MTVKLKIPRREVTDADMNDGLAIAEDLTEQIVVIDENHPGDVAFSVWVDLTLYLMDLGMTADDLRAQVDDAGKYFAWLAKETSDGNA